MPTLARAGDRPAVSSLTHLPVATRRLVELGANSCRWPLGDVDAEGFAFCNEPRLGRNSYCAAHARLSRRGSH